MQHRHVGCQNTESRYQESENVVCVCLLHHENDWCIWRLHDAFLTMHHALKILSIIRTMGLCGVKIPQKVVRNLLMWFISVSCIMNNAWCIVNNALCIKNMVNNMHHDVWCPKTKSRWRELCEKYSIRIIHNWISRLHDAFLTMHDALTVLTILCSKDICGVRIRNQDTRNLNMRFMFFFCIMKNALYIWRLNVNWYTFVRDDVKNKISHFGDGIPTSKTPTPLPLNLGMP